ncbi:MAG: class I SAM-dependent methyltransferase [Holosporaceae bacterium]|nr:class I SAM-dependent methyltransferase [Holosporaceae bacterium]
MVNKLTGPLSDTLNVTNENVLVMGFGRKYLEALGIENAYYAIPNGYPIEHWPSIRPFRTVVVDEKSMPFQPNTWDIVIVIHFMEFGGNNPFFLQELRRIIKNGGKLMIIAANKNSVFPKKCAIRNIKVSVGGIVSSLLSASFEATNVFGVNDRFGFWPYSFSYHLNKYSEVLMDIFPLLSNIVVIIAEKVELAGVPLKTLDAPVTAAGVQ